MRNILTILLVLACLHVSAQNTYDKAWKALNENKWKEASDLLVEAGNDPSTYADAFITRIYMEEYKGTQTQIKNFLGGFYPKIENPYPYIYALWFNDAVAGDYKKKEQENQVDLLKKLVADQNAPGSLVAAANYQLGMHYLFANELNNARRYYDQIGNIRNWQFAGPFENLSESGHYKNFGPLENPGPDAVFKTITNADVKWFTPAKENTDGWTPVSFHFNNSTAVVYAQNFIQSPEDQVVNCSVGVSGSVKVWINDELVISEAKERTTELDAYTVQCKLSKGTNRVLIQLGYTSNSYPNFIVRFTDEKFRAIPTITGSPVYVAYPKLSGDSKKYEVKAPFAEEYFKAAINRQPGNILNYMLLADVYLRNRKVIEARNIITAALEKSPSNCLLRRKMIEVLIKENNRTLLLEEIERIKQLDPESLLVLDLNIKELFDNQKYTEGSAELDKRIRLYGEDESSAYYKILLLVQDKKFDDLVKQVEKMYARYPTNAKVLEIMYTVKQEVYKDKKAAMKVYENYMKNNFNFGIYMKYAEFLEAQGENGKAFEIKKKMTELFPYSPSEFFTLSAYYYGIKQYDKAEESIRKSLAIAPYNEDYWEQLGDIKNERKSALESREAYNRSLQYDPNQYSIIAKIRKLDGKPEAYTLFPQLNIESIIKADDLNAAKNKDYGYYYILDQKDVVVYPGGATEEFYTCLIRITNDKGIDRYKESSISYGNYQSLLIEKAEVIKKNLSRIQGERNDNEIVFTNLEAGDVIVYKYRLQSYLYGRMAKEYTDRYYFGGQIYSAVTRYNLLMPKDRTINYTVLNSSLKPVTKDVEDFTMYTWEKVNATPDEDEPVMPPLSDVSAVLHISTIPSWKEISDWYRDISNNKAEEDFEIIALYNKLFPAGTKSQSQFQKARIIYDYIEDNIRYSSVSFRQSAYVPQMPATTLTTRLGDCKDLSSLFVTLARMAGINAYMVLVNTRDNGQKETLYPSVDFNHCIVKAELDKKEYYVELTDSYLPFTSLPNNLNGATILEIPNKSSANNSELKFLQAPNRTPDVIKRNITIKPNGSDLDISVKTIKYGHPSSSTRATYLDMDEDKQKKDIETTVASGYKNVVNVQSVSFSKLDKLNDSVEYNYDYKVKNEIAEIGTLRTFRIVYPDVVASLNNFTSDKRTYPVEYSAYEDVDLYETTVTITAPQGTKFTELPASESFSFKDMKFSLQYTLKSPDKLVVTRRFSNKREVIPAADYAAFKSFFEKIIKAEQKFIAYK